MLIIQIYNDNNKAGNRGTRVRGLITDPQAQTISQPSKIYIKIILNFIF